MVLLYNTVINFLYNSSNLFLKIMCKVGGLGDVVTGLSKALQKKGHLVEVILPKYDCMQYELIRDLKVFDIRCLFSFFKYLLSN